MNEFCSECVLMASHIESNLQQIENEFYDEMTDTYITHATWTYVSLTTIVVTFVKLCCSNSAFNIVVFESNILPGFKLLPGATSSSPVDKIQIDILSCGTISAAVPTLAKIDLNGTISGKSLSALNSLSPFFKSQPIGLENLESLKLIIFKRTFNLNYRMSNPTLGSMKISISSSIPLTDLINLVSST